MDVNEVLKSLVEQEVIESKVEKTLRKKFLEQGLENALETHGREVTDQERLKLLNQLDSEIFPL